MVAPTAPIGPNLGKDSIAAVERRCYRLSL